MAETSLVLHRCASAVTPDELRQYKGLSADALILRAFEKGIVSSPHLPGVIREWRNPTHAGA